MGMTIGWASNAPWAATGYGTQTAQAITRMKQSGHNVAVMTNYGLEGSNSVWNEIPIYSRGMDPYSNDVIPAHMADWVNKNSPHQPHALITLYDAWVLKGNQWADFNVASWVPVDHMPAPPAVAAWCRRDYVTPIAMSKFGKAMLENVDIETEYAPHGIEPVFKPTELVKLNTGESITAREYLEIPDSTFVVGMNAANKGVYPNRKAFGENLLAFSMFAKNHDDVMLYMHTDAMGSLGGIKLKELILTCGIPENKVKFVEPYSYATGIPQKVLAAIYTAMDVLLATSYGEGFGVPTVEAQACGTPVIVSDFAASKELVGDGWLVGGQPLWDAPQKSWFHIPSVPEIIDSLEQAYNRGRGRSKKATDFAKDYNADAVFNTHWKPILKTLAAKYQSRVVE
jgi:hypothetical protein